MEDNAKLVAFAFSIFIIITNFKQMKKINFDFNKHKNEYLFHLVWGSFGYLLFLEFFGIYLNFHIYEYSNGFLDWAGAIIIYHFALYIYSKK